MILDFENEDTIDESDIPSPDTERDPVVHSTCILPPPSEEAKIEKLISLRILHIVPCKSNTNLP